MNNILRCSFVKIRLMAFNHYAKIKRIIEDQSNGWVIKRINKPTSAKNFKGETIHYDHYYRIYNSKGISLKYCKFQKIDLLARTLKMPVESLPIIE